MERCDLCGGRIWPLTSKRYTMGKWYHEKCFRIEVRLTNLANWITDLEKQIEQIVKNLERKIGKLEDWVGGT